MVRSLIPLLVFLSPILAGCGGPPPQELPGGGDPRETTFAPSLGIDLGGMTEHPSGLFYLDSPGGFGPVAEPGRRVTVHYTGRLADGTTFDSSRDRGDPFSIVLGVGEVIRGWDVGIQGMRVGGTRTLVIPSEMGYGERGAGNVIPPNAVLVFEVELLEVR
jgi:FKBP-type peptidyl-prolyl cis-trans isomerase FkpA